MTVFLHESFTAAYHRTLKWLKTTAYCTSEWLELVLQVKLLSPWPGQVNAEIRANGIFLERSAHLVDPLHDCVWRRSCAAQS